MKVVAFNGSPRKNGNTSRLIKHVFNKLEEKNIECELVQLSGKISSGCTACMECKENKDKCCVITNDIVNDCITKMLEADGIIIGSPTYFAGLTPETKSLIDRVGFVARANDNMLKGKIGAAVVAVRRSGSLMVFNTINQFFLIGEMIIPGSNYWNMGIGGKEGEVESDQEGIKTMERLGENMSWLLEKINK